MTQSIKHPFELWWEDTDGGKQTADSSQSLDSYINELQQRGCGVRRIARLLTERTDGRLPISHSTVHRWITRRREGLPLA